MDKKTRGSWLIHHTNKLQKMDTQRGYDGVYLAGKAGILLSAISADGESHLATDKVNALANAAGINSVFELPALLDVLQKRQLVDRAAAGIAVLGVSTAAALQHTSDIFEAHAPNPKELASLAIAEDASTTPISAREEVERISDQFKLSSTQAAEVVGEAELLGFVDAEPLEKNERLLFNGNLFRTESPAKIKKVLDSLSPGERRTLHDVTAELQRRACLEISDVKRVLGAALFDKVMAVGYFDVNVVSNSSEEIGFVTLPAAFSKYSSPMVDDAFDLAKAFVSSITYGMTKSSYARGQIRLVERLISALVRGEAVGPVNAIQEDYKILELKGVVKVARGTKKGRTGPMMTLLKREVGELALQVIQQGDISEHSLDALPGAAVTRYRGPEENRSTARRKQVRENPAATNDILRVLRSGGF
jgi:hypothetical protein